MAKDFSFDLNKNLLSNSVETKQTTDDDANKLMDIAEEVIDIFAKYNVSYEEAYLMLASIADAIYLYSISEA